MTYKKFNEKGENKLFIKNNTVYPKYTLHGLRINSRLKLNALESAKLNDVVAFSDVIYKRVQ